VTYFDIKTMKVEGNKIKALKLI